MSWDFETGLKDDFDITVTNAYFAYHERHREGKSIALIIEGETDNDDFPVLKDDEALIFGCGEKWLTEDDGVTVVHESGQDRGFNRNSGIGKLFLSALENGGEKQGMRKKGDATEAAVWQGARFHVKRKTETAVIEGEKREFSPIYVSKFYGYVDEVGEKAVKRGPGRPKGSGKKGVASTATASATATKGKVKKAAKAEPESEIDLDAIREGLGEKNFGLLVDCAKEADDYDEFAAEAVGLKGVKKDDDLQEVILDEDNGAALWGMLKEWEAEEDEEEEEDEE